MIVDCAHYVDGRREREGALPLDEAAAHGGAGGFVWLGLLDPTVEELCAVRDSFDLHVLAVEDAQSFHLRPKIEQYAGDVRLVILRTARYDDELSEIEFGEISVFVGPAFVITVRQGAASDLRSARGRLERHPDLLRVGSVSALWAVLDQVVDGYAPVVAALETDIERVESTVFAGAVAPTESIYQLRREASDFYRAVHPLLSVVTTIERETHRSPLGAYMRDVHDHLALVNEEIAAQRELLTTVLEANIAVISMEQNTISIRQSATMERLTILATVFMPLTFVTGFFGQNFGWLVDHVSTLTAFLLLGVGGLLAPALALLWWFRRVADLSGPRRPRSGPLPAARTLRQRRAVDGRRWVERLRHHPVDVSGSG
ncbi:MAG: CorA family divalent cation transporter [Kineosporiaceae bacterium]